jgi:hypothetical protein
VVALLALGMITYMSESIPLGSALRVHGVSIIIGDALNKRFDVMLEHLAVESWLLRHRERKTIYR